MNHASMLNDMECGSVRYTRCEAGSGPVWAFEWIRPSRCFEKYRPFLVIAKSLNMLLCLFRPQ